MDCPICEKALEGGELVMVCAACHKSLGGGLAVGATGEFRISPDQLPEPEDDDTQIGEHPHATNVCSWCGKLESQVKKLLGRGGLALCDECVSLCCDILDAELGDSWR